NEKIRQALSDDDRTAYDIALHGDAAEEQGDGGDDSKPHSGVVISRREVGTGSSGLSDQGCFGKAEEKVLGGPEQFKSSLEESEQRVKSDPRFVQANRDWARCMSAAGYTEFDKPDDT